jgi:hypothetical protein
MSNDQQQVQQQPADNEDAQAQTAHRPSDEIDGLADKKPEELTPEELRLMADTMPGEGPGD